MLALPVDANRHPATNHRNCRAPAGGRSGTMLMLVFFAIVAIASAAAAVVVVEPIAAGSGPAVSSDHQYRSMVTLYIEEAASSDSDNRKRTPSGWSTRVEDGAAEDMPFVFQPGVNLIAGWTEGVLQMAEGERALLHVPASLGYGSRPMGSVEGSFYIPANSDLLFDIEILGRVGDPTGNEL